ncbi:MAG: GGDEF domain-containing protein, partial [Firmicutes bacterium]|nr:GGDEF domain-containing protein [Bacillota bacterium]
HIERDITERKELENELKDLAIKDQLTGLYNRRKIDEVLMKEKQQAGLSKQNLAIIMADIDMFKLVNDQHGHLVGDTVLIAVTKILSQGVRKTDIVGRWGGEEFMIVCPDTDLVGATVLAEKLREMVAARDFEVIGKKTCSFGVAQLRKEETIDELLLRSDLALYRAKERGRNRVETEIRKDRPIKRMNSLQKKTRG